MAGAEPVQLTDADRADDHSIRGEHSVQQRHGQPVHAEEPLDVVQPHDAPPLVDHGFHHRLHCVPGRGRNQVVVGEHPPHRLVGNTCLASGRLAGQQHKPASPHGLVDPVVHVAGHIRRDLAAIVRRRGVHAEQDRILQLTDALEAAAEHLVRQRGPNLGPTVDQRPPACAEHAEHRKHHTRDRTGDPVAEQKAGQNTDRRDYNGDTGD